MSHHIYRRKGSDSWWVDIKVNDRPRLRRSARTSDKAKAKEYAIILEDEQWERRKKGDPAVTTFAQAALMYIKDGKRDPWGYVEKLIAYFKNDKLADIKPGHIISAAKVIYPHAKPATWNRQVITPAQAIINYAAGKELCQPIRVKRYHVEGTLRSAATNAWFSAFIEAADHRLGTLATFTRTTGSRISQAVALEWADIDLTAGTAIIAAAKGHPERVGILTQELVVKLANLPLPHEGRVFGYQHHWSIYKPWRRICEAAGIPYIPTHQVGRKGFATTMQRAGVDPKTAAKRGGWKSVKLMLDVYADADSDPDLIERVFGTQQDLMRKKK